MKRLGLSLALVCALAACQSSEERAENYYKSAVSLIEAGDVDRGLVELRNVFKLNGQHRDARALYARTARARGDMKEAYGQYLRLVEQYPSDPEGTLALAEITLQNRQGAEAIRFAKALRDIYPDLGTAPPQAQAVVRAVDYAEAASKSDQAAMAAAVTAATALLDADPTLYFARQVVITDDITARRWDDAALRTDEGIAVLSAAAGPSGRPASVEGVTALRRLYDMKLGITSQQGRKSSLEGTLKQMVALFPDDPAIGQSLVRWYVSEGRLDDAEAWLRGNIKPDSTEPGPRMTLVVFLSELRGPDAGLAELDRILAEEPRPADVAANLATIRGLRAQFIYRMRDPAAAIEDMRAIIADAEKSAEPVAQLDTLRLSLAQMEDGQGNRVAAHALVAKVLEGDPTNVAALKMKGSWLIDDDKTDQALIELRTALGAAPRDPELMTLMARAHERAGNRELMAEMLSMAVEASNKAPAESIRYANYLMSERKLRPAEDVLIEALRLAPADPQLLAQLAQVHIAMADWPRAEQDIARLREVAPDKAGPIADELQARVLAGQNRMDDLTSFLASRGDQGDELSTTATIIRGNLTAGRIQQAVDGASALAQKMPDNPAAQFINASVLGYAGRVDESLDLLNKLVVANPGMVPAWSALASVYMQRNEMDRAGETLKAAIAANPDNQQLQFVLASYQERAGDLEGAIATYEKLYEKDTSQVVIANNLASLLTMLRQDPETLDRAYAMARRLRGLEVPAFQDTYGWIAFLRGDLQEALATLEPAAKGLPDLAVAQYHLGRVYAALGRKDEATAQYSRAKDLIGQDSDPKLLAEVDAAIRALDAPAAAPAQ